MTVKNISVSEGQARSVENSVAVKGKPLPLGPYLSQTLVHPQPRLWGQFVLMAGSQTEALESNRED